MDNGKTFFRFTPPETYLFMEKTRQVAYMLWGRWCHEKYEEVSRFLDLTFKVSPVRMEAACERALYYGKVSVPVIEEILEKEWDELSLDPDADFDGQLSLPF